MIKYLCLAMLALTSAPDRIVATGAMLKGAKRPLCPYPAIARYQGGDPASEQSFACRE
jgi:feruloyl esterase